MYSAPYQQNECKTNQTILPYPKWLYYLIPQLSLLYELGQISLCIHWGAITKLKVVRIPAYNWSWHQNKKRSFSSLGKEGMVSPNTHWWKHKICYVYENIKSTCTLGTCRPVKLNAQSWETANWKVTDLSNKCLSLDYSSTFIGHGWMWTFQTWKKGHEQAQEVLTVW